MYARRAECAGPYVFRCAWFMARTDIGSFDHVDLLTEATPATRTKACTAYVDEACRSEIVTQLMAELGAR